MKQKDLTNAPFRAILFELVNTACILLAQTEIDRWAATRVLMVDFSQVISDTDFVPQLPHKKLNLLIDPSRNKERKGAKKPVHGSSQTRNRIENKLLPFDSPLFEQLKAVKKLVADTAVVYLRVTTPVSVRTKGRVFECLRRR
jgi:hypothetical protein